MQLIETHTKPKQKRSELSLQKLLTASRNRIARGSFDDASIADIVKDANLSVGAFYARFKDKAALFHIIQIQTLDELQDQTTHKISAFSERQGTLANQPTINEVAEFAVDTLIETYSHSPGLLRAIYSHTLHKNDPLLAQRIQKFNLACIQQSLILLEHITEAPITERAQNVWIAGISIVGTFLREFVLFGDPVLLNNPTSSNAARKSAILMMSAYLSQQLGPSRK